MILKKKGGGGNHHLKEKPIKSSLYQALSQKGKIPLRDILRFYSSEDRNLTLFLKIFLKPQHRFIEAWKHNEEALPAATCTVIKVS